MAFQIGNKLGGKSAAKEFKDALRYELNQSRGDRTRLQLVAQALVDQAEEGNVNAIREIAERIDGKADQNITLGLNDDIAAFLINLAPPQRRDLELEAESSGFCDPMLGSDTGTLASRSPN